MNLAGDVFCRAAVFPRCIANGELANQALLMFSGKGISVRSLSLASRYLCRTDEGVHDFGMKVASAGNRRIVKRGEVLSEQNENLYLGFYNLLRSEVSDLCSEKVSVKLYWKKEDGDERHFQLDVYPKMAAVQQSVEDSISLERQEAARKGKNFPEPNRERRAERVFDQELRDIRRRIFERLWGPINLPTQDLRILNLQDEFMIRLPLA